MAAQNYSNLNTILSSAASSVVMTDYLNNLTIDELLKELSNAGVQSVNPVLLKSLIIVAVTPELCEIKVARAAAKTPRPISGENFRMQAIKILRAYLEVHKHGDIQRTAEVAHTLLTHIDRLEKWPRIEGEKYPTDWLYQTKMRISKAAKLGAEQPKVAPVRIASRTGSAK